MTAWFLQRKQKIHDRSSKLPNHTAIGGRSALDLRAEVGVWCTVVSPFDEKGPSPWSNRSFQTNFTFAVSLIALRAMRAAPLARCDFSSLSFKFSLCAVPGATLCVFVAILIPCTFKWRMQPTRLVMQINMCCCFFLFVLCRHIPLIPPEKNDF
jgi:hypothetical protein